MDLPEDHPFSRAEKLYMDIAGFTPDQKQVWVLRGRYEFKTPSGKRFVQFRNDIVIWEVCSNYVVRHCIYIRDLPPGDSHIANMLAVKYNESYFRSISNPASYPLSSISF